MGKQNVFLHSFASGIVDKKRLPRIDLAKMRLMAEVQTNFLADTVGRGFFRPGLQYVGETAADGVVELRDFVRSETESAIVVMGDQTLRILDGDALITRVTVATVVTSGDFSASTGWTLGGTGGGVAAIAGGKLALSNISNVGIASAKQTLTVAAPDIGVRHAFRIIVTRGPVYLRVGSASGLDDLISEATLQDGTHSLAFTPSGASVFIDLEGRDIPLRYVDSIQIEAAGIMQLPTPWGVADLSNIRMTQSIDVLFVACTGFQQRRIERRGANSWSIVLYKSDDGPMRIGDNTITLTPSVLNGNGTLTASRAFFTAGNVMSLFRLTQTGQLIDEFLAAADTYTDAIRMSGVSSALGTANNPRAFKMTISGTWVGTLTVQRSSTSATIGFTDVETHTANVSKTISDTFDNSVIWYRVGFKIGDYTSGSAEIVLDYANGGGDGICRVTGFTSSTVVDIEVLAPTIDMFAFRQTTPTQSWYESEWSDRRGWPSAVSFYDGRLWWAGADRFWGSISDAYASFDDTFVGDAGPISRSIATGGLNRCQWVLALQRLIFGTDGTVTSARSSSLDEPLTPTNLTLRDASTIGCYSVAPARIDARGIFADRSRQKLFELTFDSSVFDYVATEITKLVADVFASGVRKMSVQRRPDTRIWVVLADGSCVCVLYEPAQEILAFIPIATSGLFESVVVSPGPQQDIVTFAVARTINGVTKRFLERMALDSEVKPSTLCKVMDAHVTGHNSPASATLTVGTQFNGASFVAWADGVPYPGPFVVSGGVITLPAAVTDWVAGIGYAWRYKSSRLAYAAQAGTAMLMPKKVDHIGLIMTDFHRDGLHYGPSFDTTYPLPTLDIYKQTKPTIVLSDINDEDMVDFGGDWSTDSRVCMMGQSPYPVSLIGLVITISTNDRL